MKLFQADLTNASSTVQSGADNVKAASEKVAQSITDFTGNSDKELKGTGYDYVRSKMTLYLAAVQKLGSLVQMLAENIVSANNQVINETKGYDLDTTEKEELRQEVARVEQMIRFYSETIVVDDTVPEEERKYKMRDKANKEKYEAILAFLKEQLELLDNLESITSSAAALLDTVTGDNNTFAYNVDSITVSSF